MKPSTMIACEDGGLSLKQFLGVVIPLLQLYWRWYSPARTIALKELSDKETYVRLQEKTANTSGTEASKQLPDERDTKVVGTLADSLSTITSGATVCVTGGCGFVGSAIVRHLRQAGNNVVVVDINIPSSVNSAKDRPPTSVAEQPPLGKMGHVIYHEMDVVAGDLRPVFENVDVVVHTAGVVVLSDDPGLLHNAHVVATRNVVRWARTSPRVAALVVSSSSGAVTTPYTSKSQLNLSSDFKPGPNFNFPSHYSKTKFNAEQIALAANDPAHGFAVCALRMPGIYGCYPDGRGDPLMVGPLLNGFVTAVPTRPGCKVDFCYVENAAHAHAVAVAALLPSQDAFAAAALTPRQRVIAAYGRSSGGAGGGVAGRTFNITNGECFDDVLHGWNTMLEVCDVPHRIRELPYTVGWMAACISEVVFWFTAGHVPAPKHAFWNLTRSTLHLARTSITLHMSPDLPYTPLYDNAASFRDIRKRYRSVANTPATASHLNALKRVFFGAATETSTQHDMPDPLPSPTEDIDWTPRSGTVLSSPFLWQQRGRWMLDQLAGPAPTWWEILLTLCALGGTIAVMHSSALPTWTPLQYGTACVLATVNGAAAVQCTCGQSKRWYHPHGQLPWHLAGVMAAETVAQCCIVAWVFTAEPLAYAVRTSLWYLVCFVLLLPISVGTSHRTTHRLLPLHAQRPAGVLLMLASIALTHGPYHLVPPAPGLEWLGIVLPTKYLVSHAVRHEPYVDGAHAAGASSPTFPDEKKLN